MKILSVTIEGIINTKGLMDKRFHIVTRYLLRKCITRRFYMNFCFIVTLFPLLVCIIYLFANGYNYFHFPDIILPTSHKRNNITFPKNSDAICTSSKNNTNELDLIILVLCKINDITSRKTIRETWGSIQEQRKGKFRVIFVVGQTENDDDSVINNESKTDILKLDTRETYRHINEKVTKAFLWTLGYCKKVKYIMKTDTDVFINVPNVLKILNTYSFDNVIGGYCFEGYEYPRRNSRSKWYVSEKDYPSSNYPPYCSGSGYVMKYETAAKIAVSFYTTPYFPMEDVYIGFTAYKNKISIKKMPGFSLGYITYNPKYYCNCLAVTHTIKPNAIRTLWRKHKNDCRNRWERTISVSHCFIAYKYDSQLVFGIFIVAVCFICICRHRCI